MTSPNAGRNAQTNASAETPPPDKVNQFHRYSDVDNSPDSHHHSLGPGQTQASPGSHSHDGRDSNILSAYSVQAHTHLGSEISVIPVGTVSSVDVQAAISELDSEKADVNHVHNGGGHDHDADYVNETDHNQAAHTSLGLVADSTFADLEILFWMEI